MPRLSARDSRRLSELEESLGSFRPGAPPTLEAFAPTLREVLDAERIGAYSLRVENGRLLPEVFGHTGMSCSRAETRRRFENFIARNPRRPGAYDAARPEPLQRNRIHEFPPTLQWIDTLDGGDRSWEERLGTPWENLKAHLSQNHRPFLHPLGIDRPQMRILLCEGQSLLAYVCAIQDEPFAPRQRSVFKRLLPALRARLKLEQQLRDAPLAAASLDAALQAIPAAAFLVTKTGAIRAMNAAGAALRRKDPRHLAALLRDSARGEPTRPAFRKTPIALPGLPGYHLAVREPETRVDAARLAAARRRWGLTERQTEVLARLVRGDTNKAIAVELGLGQSTVELHVTRLLDRFEATSRAELIARFWMMQ